MTMGTLVTTSEVPAKTNTENADREGMENSRVCSWWGAATFPITLTNCVSFNDLLCSAGRKVTASHYVLKYEPALKTGLFPAKRTYAKVTGQLVWQVQHHCRLRHS